MRPTIRTAKASERTALSELHRRSSLVWPDTRAVLEAHPEVFGVDSAAIEAGCVRVALGEGGELLGFATVQPGEAGACVLADLFVEPDRHREGTGTALVEDAARRARDAGLTEMLVIANPGAVGFYEQVGFRAGEQAETQFGPGLLMHCPLAGKGA